LANIPAEVIWSYLKTQQPGMCIAVCEWVRLQCNNILKLRWVADWSLVSSSTRRVRTSMNLELEMKRDDVMTWHVTSMVTWLRNRFRVTRDTSVSPGICLQTLAVVVRGPWIQDSNRQATDWETDRDLINSICVSRRQVNVNAWAPRTDQYLRLSVCMRFVWSADQSTSDAHRTMTSRETRRHVDVTVTWSTVCDRYTTNKRHTAIACRDQLSLTANSQNNPNIDEITWLNRTGMKIYMREISDLITHAYFCDDRYEF